jgi:hypothetical protein
VRYERHEKELKKYINLGPKKNNRRFFNKADSSY